jgi:lysophospholipase L1-like esterase
MGVQSDGVWEGTQEQSWVVQLARKAGHDLSIPRIAAPGCGSPLADRLITFQRTSGESAGKPFETRDCAPNVAGVTLPTANVSVDGALTVEALTRTPNPAAVDLRSKQYGRVLGPGQTQVSAMLAQDPDIVSVELGANDIMGVRNGAYLPFVTFYPLEPLAGRPGWKQLYASVLNAVQSTTDRAIVVGLIDDAMQFPGFRTGSELAAAREVFLSEYNVLVHEDCSGSGANNVLFVPVRVVGAIGEGLQRRQIGPQAGSATLSCANAAVYNPAQPDYVLTPGEIDAVNAHLAAMNAFMRQEAEARGFAYVELEVIYGRPNAKPRTFDPVRLMTSARPYGPYVSLDGIHPNGVGARILARAAARALDERYHLGIGRQRGTIADDDSDNH